MKLALFVLWGIEIDLTAIFSFLIGIFLGATIICMIYALFVLGSLRNKKFLIKTDDDTLTVQDVKEMISNTQVAFKDKSLRGDLSRVAHCKNLISSLVLGIASKFYPKSKLPLLELSIDEALMLTVYVERRLDEILNKRGIRLIKKIKISTIVDLTQKTTKAIDSKAFKIAKEANGALNVIKKVINAVNPAWWFKKLVMNKTMDIITDKLCLVIIAVVGEETYKIYSKTVFNEEVSIETDVDNLLDSIDKDLVNASMEVKNNQNNSNIVVEEVSNLDVKFKSKVLALTVSEDYVCIFDSKYPLKKKNEDSLVS